jgi:site-specific recombinase XerD
MDIKVSIVLDKRRVLDNGKYPVKVRVWHYALKKAKLYKTDYTMFSDDYKKSWGSGKNKQDLSGLNLRNYNLMDSLYDWALEQANGMDYFEFKEYGKRLNRRPSDTTSIKYHFEKTINELEEGGRYGTASSYRCAMVSLQRYASRGRGNAEDCELHFMDITPKWLKGYEKYMVETKGSSITTVSIYTRTLRVIFNTAIKERKDLDKKYYPFGKGKYKIRTGKKVKKTLTSKHVAIFYNAELPPLQEQARDYWFFSYLCKGMNFRDISYLKYRNLKDNKISYIREKTKNRDNISEIVINLNDIALEILDKYKSTYKGENSYIFPILKDSDNPKQIFAKVNNFIRATNQQLKHIANTLGFPKEFSTYWARHGYATNMINAGASLERIQEDLDHLDISTTQRYFDGFDKEVKDKFMDKLISNLKSEKKP